MRDMLALVAALAVFPSHSYAEVSTDPVPREVHESALEEARKLSALLERMRRDCPDAGVGRKCTDAGPEPAQEPTR